MNALDRRKLFLKLKPAQILIEVKKREESYALQISQDVDVTYSHTVRTLEKMKDADLAGFETRGRKKLVYLTPKGEEAAETLESFWEVLG